MILCQFPTSTVPQMYFTTHLQQHLEAGARDLHHLKVQVNFSFFKNESGIRDIERRNVLMSQSCGPTYTTTLATTE